MAVEQVMDICLDILTGSATGFDTGQVRDPAGRVELDVKLIPLSVEQAALWHQFTDRQGHRVPLDPSKSPVKK